MKTSLALLSVRCAVCVTLLAAGVGAPAQDGTPPAPSRTIVGDLLMIDGDFYIVRGDQGEIQIEATPDTTLADGLRFGDRIKALALMNNKALLIERAGPGDVPGVVLHGARPASGKAGAGTEAGAAGAEAAAPAGGMDDDAKVVEGQILMVDGDFYVIRGALGEIRVERTPDTKMTEEFKFGDFIKATVTATDRALAIERLP